MTFRATALTIGAASLLAALAPVAPAAADDAWPVPDDATITVDGHGFGHGHGLSQYGALGAATAGLGVPQIVDFYYPGTTWGRPAGAGAGARSPPTPRPDLVVDARRGLTVRAVGGATVTAAVAALRARATRWRIQPLTGGRSAVAVPHHALARAGARSTATPSSPPAARRSRCARRAGRWPTAARCAPRRPPGGGRDTVNVVASTATSRACVPQEMRRLDVAGGRRCAPRRSRPAPTRRTSAAHTGRRRLRPVRHRRLPGVRRRQRGVPRDQRGGRTPPPGRC